ncbi:ead/Ea22-like family protein [Escherichia coli]|uniref:ead/Ea22-like family protein n=1 Tax=Escherichia fergusonii TaxID=564 RepID=UPI0015E4F47D|nr:ead/Ea22-like family protein [Salmonella enterica]EKO5041763.1 ead/Ea22-like family protein [Escherichia coli]ELG5751034.1 ead/Ea22-like family protein [Salmonella enterica subsp. enterica serovar Infantis]MBY7556670.1 ead/Ea22-like family protein [Escherichia fergusonii]QLN40480.1 ead/Ea22-like family protein [Escherichia fergusonii]
MSEIDYQALREIAKQATQSEWVAFISPGTGTYAVHTPGDKRCEDVIKWTGFDGQKNAENNARYIAAFNPEVVQALLAERERNQQYIKRRDQENEEIALTVGKLRVELEAAESKLNEQREYYEGVISDGSKRIAELEKQCAEWERKALSNFEECAAMAERIEELEQANTGQDTNINSQQERVTQSANRHVYHYNAVSNVSGITMSGIAQSPFRIKSQSDLEEFKSALSKVCGFHATAITSLSYLGREEEE